jgi:uncharacterized protein YcbK (DUF882 family)
LSNHLFNLALLYHFTTLILFITEDERKKDGVNHMKILATTILLFAAITTAQDAYCASKHKKVKYTTPHTAWEDTRKEMPVELADMKFKLLKPIQGVSRTWKELDAEYSNRLASVFVVMRQQHGYEMTMLEGYRSPERQDSLFNGATGVTQARGFQSYHQYGLASDCAFLKNGKLMVDARDPWTLKGYKLFGEVAKSVGLVWGGSWAMKDFGHTELHAAKGMFAMDYNKFMKSRKVLIAQN